MGRPHGVVRSVLWTFAFHVTTVLYGLVLIALLALTGAGLTLTLVCAASGSTRNVRVFAAWLWRTEMRINTLVAASPPAKPPRSEEPMAPNNRSSSSSIATSSVPPRGREVTASVMMFSILYFLLFKGLFNVVFSAIPLALWFIAVVQVLPSRTADTAVALGDSTFTMVFAMLAVSFFAHQIGVTAATASVAVSRKIQKLIFQEDHDARGGGWASDRTPLLPTDSFSHASYAEYQTTQHQEQLARHWSERNRHTGGMGPSALARPPHSFPSPFAPPPPPPPPAHGGSEQLAPPLPPLPPIPPGSHSHNRAQSQGHDHDQAFREDVAHHELHVCCLKLAVDVAREQPQRQRGRRGVSGSGARGRGGRHHNSFHGIHDRFAAAPASAAPVQRCRSASSSSSSSSSSTSSASPHRRGKRSHRLQEGEFHRFPPKHTERHRLVRSNSFDSGQVAHGRTLAGFDLKHPGHQNIYEVLDLRPSAPPLPESYNRRGPRMLPDYPVALLAETHSSHGVHYPPPQQLHKSLSEGPRHYSDLGDQSMRPASAQLEMFTTKQMLKEQAKQLKVAAKRMKEEYKNRAKALKREAHRARSEANRLKKNKQDGAEDCLGFGALEAVGSHSHFDADYAQPVHSVKILDRRVQAQQADDAEEKQPVSDSQEITDSSESSLDRVADVQSREMFAREIEQAAQEEVERQRRELDAPSQPPPQSDPHYAVTMLSSNGSSRSGRTRGRRLTSSDQEVRVYSADQSSGRIALDSIALSSSQDPRSVSLFSQYQAGIISDQEIHGIYGSIPRNLEDPDYMGISGFGGITFSSSPAELVTSIDTGPVYRSTSDSHPEYNAFSPLSSPLASVGTSSSFLNTTPQYDVLSPTHSLKDSEDPSEHFQQVYRSIRFTDDPPVVASRTSVKLLSADVPGTRDKVHFCSFAPPSVAPSRQAFQFTVWAFLMNQRIEMQEMAETLDPSAKKMSVDAKIVVRRGAIVHVTLEVPDGFKVLNGATQGFPWEGKVSNVQYDVECTDDADFGQVLFKASIVVGSEVAVLRSYIMVSSKKLESGEMEAQLLESSLEVLDKTFQEIPYRDLELKQLVGSGYFGDAYLANYNGEDVVVKTIRASEFGETNDQILREFQHEAAVLSMFGHHPCVVPFVGASTELPYPLCLVTKYLPYGSLEDNLKNEESREQLSTRKRTLMLKDAAAGLLNIHEGGFIHRDIAARNCLVDHNLRVKICDFGLCRRVNAYGGSLMKDSVGPVKYMAPESLQPPHSFSFDSDSWMFGVLMWETYTASVPHSSLTPMEAMIRIVRGERLAVPEDLPDDLQSLMESCFHDTPSQRPSMAEILQSLDAFVSQTGKRPGPVAVTSNALEMAALSNRRTMERRDQSIWV